MSAQLDDPRPLLTIPETAGYLGVSRWTVYRLIDDGLLKATRVNRVWRIRPWDIDAYLAVRNIEAAARQAEATAKRKARRAARRGAAA